MPMPYWAEWAGLAATLIALGITIWQSIRARKASELARKEVLRFRVGLDRHELASTLGAVIETLDETRRQRIDENPAAVQERCAVLRRRLSELAEAGSLAHNERADVSVSQQQIARLSNRLAYLEIRPFEPRDRAEFAQMVLVEVDRLSKLLARLKRQIGEDS